MHSRRGYAPGTQDSPASPESKKSLNNQKNAQKNFYLPLN